MRIATVLVMVVAIAGSATAAGAEGYQPDHVRIRAGLQRAAGPRVFQQRPPAAVTTVRRQTTSIRPRRDSIWNGLLIGAAAGAGGGYLWARDICGSNDKECFYIAGPVGVLAGAGIGAAVGAVLDALHR